MAKFTTNPHRFDSYRNFKFRVKWDGKYVAGVSEVGALKGNSKMEVKCEGGTPSTSHKSPGKTKYQAITLERGVTHDPEFEQWADKNRNNESGLGSEFSLKDFRRDIIIEMYNEAEQLVIAYKVFRCWVSEFKAQPDLDPNANAVAIQSIKLENEGWERCNVVEEPSFNQFDRFVKRIVPIAKWEDLVLPKKQVSTLRDLSIQFKQRAKDLEEREIGDNRSSKPGISAFFVGECGTGKTMASEVLANELKLDLYRIDLTQVVNKYIGETEKNLKRIFDAAGDGGAILLFDEADALFGKRSEVKGSHDRFAKTEVNYFLQCINAYPGLTILTTNNTSNIDKAFLSSIRFIVQFTCPGAKQRAQI